MAEKKLKTRIQSKHDTEQNWTSAVNFRPLAGEFIIYDEDSKHELPRLKIGNGDPNTQVEDLPFVVDKEATDAAIAKAKADAISEASSEANAAISAAATEAVSTSKTYTNNKTANMNKEAYLTWGGKNHAGTWGPIDGAMIPELGANRLAFLPSTAVKLYYSINGGTAWSEHYGYEAEQLKSTLFSTGSRAFYIGNNDATGIDKTAYMSRILINTTGTLYSILNKFVIKISTGGSDGSYCTIEARKKSDEDAGNDTWKSIATGITINGWSGWNVINISGLTTHGNTADQYSQIRLTFGVTSHASTIKHAGLGVYQIMAFGGEGWTTPSTMARHGHIYNYDENKNVQFPANLTVNNGIVVKENITMTGEDGTINIGNSTYLNSSGLETAGDITANVVSCPTISTGAVMATEVSASYAVSTTSVYADCVDTTSMTGSGSITTTYLHTNEANALEVTSNTISANDISVNGTIKLPAYDPDTGTGCIEAGLFKGSLDGTARHSSQADSATAAIRDYQGNIIHDTYATAANLTALETAVENLFSIGTADPTSSTTGKVYFKYLN